MRPLPLALVLSLLVCPALAALVEDAVYDDNHQPIYDSSGDCVRTKWQSGMEPYCGGQSEKSKFVPMPIPAAQLSEEERTVYFEFNKTDLTKEARTKLDGLAEVVNRSSEVTDVRIHGYTDQIGTEGYNKTLADKRAARVKAYLDKKSRLRSTLAEVKGLGKSAPTQECESIAERTKKISCMYRERRVEVELTVKE